MNARARHAANQPELRPARLWFGFAAAPAAWAVHGLSSFFISWQACQDGRGDWGFLSGLEVRWLMIAVSTVLLAVAIAATVVSLLNWRHLGHGEELTRSDAPGQAPFMALTGFFIGIAFIAGILWGSMGPVLLEICVTAK